MLWIKILVVLLSILFLVWIFARRTNSNIKLVEVPQETKFGKKLSDSETSTTGLINKFHYYIGYPCAINGLNRSQRRKIKRHYKKFLWNWHELTEEQQDISKIIEYIIYGPGRFVFMQYKYWFNQNYKAI